MSELRQIADKMLAGWRAMDRLAKGEWIALIASVVFMFAVAIPLKNHVGRVGMEQFSQELCLLLMQACE